MNILFVFENKKSSANANIAIKLARELSKQNKVHIGLVYVANDYIDAGLEFGTVVKLGFYDDKLLDFRNRIKWNNISGKKKIIEFIKNPYYFLRFLKYKYYTAINHRKFINDIEKYISENDIGAVVGVVNPYNIADMVAEIKSPIKRYIIQLDPYSTHPSVKGNELAKRVRHEKTIHSVLDGVFTTDLIIDDCKRLGIVNDKEKIVQIEFPLIEAQDNNIEVKAPILEKKNGEIYFVHLGMFYADIRNPQILVNIFDKLPSNYKLVVAGPNSEMIFGYTDNKDNRIIDLGLLSQNKCTQIISEADFLICFNNKVANMVPSKLFECINSGKPFLNICQIKECPTKKYVNNYKLVCDIDVYNNAVNTDVIIDFVSGNRGKKIDKKRIMNTYKACTIGHVAIIINNTIKND